MVGKNRRMKRVLKNGKGLIAPMDHGITKPAIGLENMERILRAVDCGADAVVVHKGIAKNSEYLKETSMGLIIHLSASTSMINPNDKRIVTSVEKALQLGADMVSVHVNVGSETEREQLVEVGEIVETCDSYGLPLLAMMYPRGQNIEVNTETVKHAVRVGYELGADIIKTSYPGEGFVEVVEETTTPIVIAGGSKTSDSALLEQIRNAMLEGASGAAVGRNIFQHPHPDVMVKALSRVIHNDNVELAREVLNERNMAALHGR